MVAKDSRANESRELAFCVQACSRRADGKGGAAGGYFTLLASLSNQASTLQRSHVCQRFHQFWGLSVSWDPFRRYGSTVSCMEQSGLLHTLVLDFKWLRTPR